MLIKEAQTIQRSPQPWAEIDKKWMSDFTENLTLAIVSEQKITREEQPNNTTNHLNPQLEIEEENEVINEVIQISEDDEEEQQHAKIITTAETSRQRSEPSLQNIRMNDILNKPDKFQGQRSSARRWLDDFECASIANNWTNSTKVRIFPGFLEKSAREWYAGIIQPYPHLYGNWSILRAKFVRFFIGPEELDTLKEEIRKARQKKDEGPLEFIARMMRLLNLADPHQSEVMKVKEIKSKLKNFYQEKMIGLRPKTLDELTDLCSEIDEHIENSRARKNFFDKSVIITNADKEQKGKEDTAEPKASQSKPFDRTKLTCDHCNMSGHSKERCWELHPELKRTTTTKKVGAVTSSSIAPSDITVFKHISSAVATANNHPENAIMWPVKINDIELKAMIDTGSSLSLIDVEIARKLNLKGDGENLGLCGANQQPLECEGWIRVKLIIRVENISKMVNISIGVIKNLCVAAIIGNDLLKLLQIGVSATRKSVYFEDVEELEDVIIPPRSEMMVKTPVPKPVQVGSIVMTIPIESSTSVLIGNSISIVDDKGRAECLVANLEKKPLRLPKDRRLISCEHLEEGENQKDIICATTNRLAVGDTDEMVNVGSELSESQLRDLDKLIRKHPKVFSIKGCIGETDIVEHDIELIEGAKPVVEPLRRRPLFHKLEAQRQVDKMLVEGILERSSSPWAAAYVLVRKKTGDIRLCIDFRKLNNQTKKMFFLYPT